MSSNNIYGSGMLFQAMNEELNASLATADELSREFSSLFQEVSSTTGSSTAQSTNSRPQNTISSKPSASSITSSISSGTKPSVSSGLEFSSSSTSRDGGGGGTFSKATMPTPQTSASSRYTEPSIRSADSYFLAKSITSSPNPQTQQYTSSQPRHVIPESAYSRGTLTPPNMSPLTQRKLFAPPNRSHVRSLSGSYNIAELTTNPKYDPRTSSSTLPLPGNSASPYESSTTGRRSPRVDRVPSPNPFSQPVSSTLPRNFMPFKSSDDTISRKRTPGKWNETDLDVSYERKTHHTYEKSEWMRQNVPNSNWRESNLDSATSPKKDTLPCHLPPIDGTLTRTTRISVPPDRSSPNPSLYNTPPIISRISIPPTTSGPRPHRPIPLSIIMRLQNPYYATATRHPHGLEGDMSLGMPLAQEFLYHFQPVAPEQRQTPAVSSSGPADVDAEVARLNTLNRPAVPSAEQNKQSKQEVPADDVETEAPPRPLSPSRLQPVVAPADDPLIPDLTEVLRIRAEFPRALKKRGSVDVSPSFKPPQYKQMIKKLFRMKGPQLRNEPENESGCSSDDESLSPATPTPPALTSINLTPQQRGLHSILRKPKGSGAKTQSGRARLSPLVLLLDGALVGELDTVQRAVQEMSDPSQPNDEGITALHNAICGGHYAVVEFLVCIGANVSAPDSHGWTPLHCAASCNDRALCEYLVRNGAAVMAVTESDQATAAQKCDPYAVGYEECESFLRGVEEAMGVENSGVLYALWTYPAQAPDELSFREGDMVTILQKPEGVNWWWASLCGREGFVPNNYFGLFPKVRPKSLC